MTTKTNYVTVAVNQVQQPPSTVPLDSYLAGFPRPVGDNGRGLHFVLDQKDSLIDQYVPILKQMKIKWTTVYGTDELTTTKAQTKLLAAGIFSVNRIEARQGALKKPDFWLKLAQRIISMGLPPYVQIFNEPEMEFDSISTFASTWNVRAEAVLAGGAIPCLQVMSEEYFNAAVDGMSAACKKRFAFIQHNYGANHPPSYPYNLQTNAMAATGQRVTSNSLGIPLSRLREALKDPVRFPGAEKYRYLLEQYEENRVMAAVTPEEDDTCVLRFIAIADWARKKLGYVMPIIGGEGGWLYQNHDDQSLPPVTADKWVPWHIQMFEWFRTGLIPGPNGGQQKLPDYLFSITPWLVYASNWYSDSWFYGLDADKKKPLTDQLASDSIYVRFFGGGTVPPVGTVSFTLTPDTIKVGETAVLAWNCQNVKEVYLNGQGVVGVDQRVITPSTSGQIVFVLRVVYIDGTTKDFTLTLTVNSTTTPPPPTTIFDPEFEAAGIRFEGVYEGQTHRLVKVWAQKSDSLPVPNNDASESRNIPQIVVRVLDKNGFVADDVIVIMSTSPTDVAATTTINGITDFDMSTAGWSFNPANAIGPGKIQVGDAWVKGFGLPLSRHWRFIAVFQAK